MLDRFEREINYLRISVTDRCNLRCVYCMPEEGVPLRNHEDFLSHEEITEVVKAGTGLGLTRIRLTGGEPLVKRGVVELIGMIKAVKGVEHLAMSTNGTLVERMAGELRRAGLDSMNISLDTLDPARYRELTRIGDLQAALRGIEAALNAGFPLKLNMVVFSATGAEEIGGMQSFCVERGITLQLINHYSLVEEKMNNYSFDRPPDCARCNRIRLLSDGRLKPCLHSDDEIKLDLSNIEASLLKAIENKPERGSVCINRHMSEIGG
ncbi:GTP 3',8-cyclase 2 [subsurface metagenome]